MSEKIRCEVEPIKCCEACGGESVFIRVIYWPPNNLQIRYVCEDCGESRALPHRENLKKRTNSTLASWRKKVLERDNYTCRICGSKEELHAHHVIPVGSLLGEEFKYTVGNGITLCKGCHDKVHRCTGRA